MTNRSIEPISHRQAIAGLSASLLIGGGVLIGDAGLGRQRWIQNDSTGQLCGAFRCEISTPKPHRFWQAIAGTILIGCGAAVSRYCCLGPDLADLGKMGSGAIWEWLNEALAELQPTEPQQQRLVQIAVNAAPIQIKTWIQQVSADTSWFEKWLKGHNRIAGETDSGKTTLAEASFAHHLHNFPDSTVAICDINFGKRDKDWLGINPDYIYPDIDQIAAIIAHEYKELCDRRQRCIATKKSGKEPPKFTPRLLVVDELDSTAEDLGGKDSEPLKQLRAIAKQGLGYGLKLILIGQSLAVGETGISLATSKQFSSILIVKGKLPRSELTYLNPSNADELEEKVKQLQKAGHRVAIAQLGETTPEVVVIPDLSHLKTIRLNHRDPVADWWRAAWTPDMERWATEQATRYVKGEIESPLKPLAKRLGIQTLNSDPRYSQYLKPRWEAILSSAKEGNQS